MAKTEFKVTENNAGWIIKEMPEGALFEYSDALLLEDIYRLAFEQGRMVSYCQPGSDEYRHYGSNVCRVTYVHFLRV